jgi:hypothetical protein
MSHYIPTVTNLEYRSVSPFFWPRIKWSKSSLCMVRNRLRRTCVINCKINKEAIPGTMGQFYSIESAFELWCVSFLWGFTRVSQHRQQHHHALISFISSPSFSIPSSLLLHKALTEWELSRTTTFVTVHISFWRNLKNFFCKVIRFSLFIIFQYSGARCSNTLKISLNSRDTGSELFWGCEGGALKDGDCHFWDKRNDETWDTAQPGGTVLPWSGSQFIYLLLFLSWCQDNCISFLRCLNFHFHLCSVLFKLTMISKCLQMNLILWCTLIPACSAPAFQVHPLPLPFTYTQSTHQRPFGQWDFPDQWSHFYQDSDQASYQTVP